jgi:hypothetical protein
MIGIIKNWFAARQKKKEALDMNRAVAERAWQAFAAVYPERMILRNWQQPPVQGRDGSRIVCVIWDHAAIPPARSWWREGDEGFSEISHEEAAQVINVPVWR